MNRGIAVLMAFLLGWIGIHKFYVGRCFQGFLYLLFSWTGIPSLFAIVDAIRWLLMNDSEFDLKYCK